MPGSGPDSDMKSAPSLTCCHHTCRKTAFCMISLENQCIKIILGGKNYVFPPYAAPQRCRIVAGSGTVTGTVTVLILINHGVNQQQAL